MKAENVMIGIALTCIAMRTATPSVIPIVPKNVTIGVRMDGFLDVHMVNNDLDRIVVESSKERTSEGRLTDEKQAI